EAAVADLDPRRLEPVDRVEVVADDDHLPRLLAQGDDVALAHAVARNVHALAVDVDQPVADELTGLGSGGGPASAEDDVVQALLEHAEQVLARDALLAAGLLVEVGELALEDAVDVLGL